MILINEIYRAHQGEGTRIGVPSVFIRTHLCPVECSWCDTAFTWDGSESGKSVTVDSLVNSISTDFPLITNLVWTGGEPLVQKPLPYAVRALSKLGYQHEIETSAAFMPKAADEWMSLNALYNLSPKMPSAEPKMYSDPMVLAKFFKYTDSVFKIVVRDLVDLNFAIDMLDKVGSFCGGVDPKRVYLMPCGTSRDEVGDGLSWLMPKAMDLGFRITTRMQVTAFNDQRGT